MFNIQDVPGLEDDLIKVNKHIERLCRSNSQSMQKMMDWILAARGKQIRPILTLLCSRLKNKQNDASEMAAVIEICHTASLIHDDIIDDADTRRGQLSVYKKFGKEMAVYAGDFMIFATLGKTELRLKPWYRDMFNKLEVMCDGEVNQFDNQYNTEIDENEYIENIRGKTSAMFSIACVVGAYEGGCTKKERNRIDKFAENFGLLFQMRDDLMNFISTKDKSLKTVHNDFCSGYYTLPAIHTFDDHCVGAKLKEIAQQVKKEKMSNSTCERIDYLIRQADGYRYTINMIEKYYNEAKACLNSFDDTLAKKKLIELLDYLWDTVKKIEIK